MDKKLTVQPAIVTFSVPLTEHQTVDLDIRNDWNKAIIFKMKTTRPDAFKMKPVYGLIEAGDKKKVILTLRKWDPNKKLKKNDHFTVVMAPAPDKCNDPMKVWKSWKENKRSEVSIGACRREVKIIYKGITEVKKKPSKAEMAKTTAVKDEEIAEKKEEKVEAAKQEEKEDEDERKRKWKPKKKEEEDEEEQEEKPKKKTGKGKKEEEEGGEEEEEEEEDNDEKPKKKPKEKEEEKEDGKGKGEEADKEDEEE
ncbi:unnamed protein product [Onchocerca ochengi]|uniref:Major sperm protein n=1 Tax=Onchocerca ochengi TaxID=42157 RepID=A0A182EE60_ONCOC|nr:unnamed protein product [Onchocerca ochengi]